MDSDPTRRWAFIPIEKKLNREQFDCGYPVLNEYLKKYALQNHKKEIAKTIVATPLSEPLQIDGYYTASASSIDFEFFPPTYQKRLPAYPLPVMLIGKLAVDTRVQGQGLGEELLVDALNRAVKASSEIGIFAVRVDAIDSKAQEFYLKYEFIRFQSQPLSLFLPIKTILEQFIEVSRF